MKKNIFAGLCIVLTIAVISGIIAVNKSGTAAKSSKQALTSQQKQAIKTARQTGEPMSDAEIDTFTIKQGKQFFDQYLQKKHLSYATGSQKYINYLNKVSIGESARLDGPKFTIIGAYASVYSQEIQKHQPTFFRFHLKESTLNKTIKQIRQGQEKWERN